MFELSQSSLKRIRFYSGRLIRENFPKLEVSYFLFFENFQIVQKRLNLHRKIINGV